MSANCAWPCRHMEHLVGVAIIVAHEFGRQQTPRGMSASTAFSPSARVKIDL